MKRYGGPWQELRALLATSLIGLAQRVHCEASMDLMAVLSSLRRK